MGGYWVGGYWVPMQKDIKLYHLIGEFIFIFDVKCFIRVYHQLIIIFAVLFANYLRLT